MRWPTLASARPDPPPSGDRAEGLDQRLRRRPLFRAAFAVLLALYSAAVYAPLIANDRPYYLEAIDYRAYEAARRTLEPVTAALVRLAEEGPGDDAAAWTERLAAERRAADQRVEVMRAALSGPDDSLRGYAAEVAALVDDARAQAEGGRRRALGAELERRAAALVAELEPLRPGEEGAGVSLRARTSWPLFAALTPVDVLAMLAWTALLAWPLLRRLGRRTRVALVLLVPLAGALAAGWLAPSTDARGGPSVKQGLTTGEVVARRALLPPVYFGVAETHTGEGFRPPTWTRAAARDEAGRPLSARTEEGLAGLEPAATPIAVRFGEPARNAPWRRLAGTDGLGRDLFARLLWGGRVSLSVGLIAALGLTLIGLLLGSLAGFLGGRFDFGVSRLIEVVLSVPALYLIVLAAAYVDPRALPPLAAIVLIIALVAWTGVARLARAEMLRLRESDFVLAARSLGLPAWRVLLVHALPNALSPILVAATFAVGGAILTESVVSYLGFGVQHPVPSWGALVNESRSAEHWWIQLLPGLAIFLAVAAFNLVGEALRDALDPRAKGPPS